MTAPVPHGPLPLPHSKFELIANVSQLPVVPGALYALDIDETLLDSVWISKSENSHAVPVRTHCARHAPDVAHVNHLATVADVVYVTFRDSNDEERTKQELQAAGFPLRKIYFSCNKGVTMKEEVLKDKTYPCVLFADDWELMVQTVKKAVPSVQCYKVDTYAYDTLKAAYDNDLDKRGPPSPPPPPPPPHKQPASDPPVEAGPGSDSDASSAEPSTAKRTKYSAADP